MSDNTTVYRRRVWLHSTADYWLSANIDAESNWRRAELSISDGNDTAFFVLDYSDPGNYLDAANMLTLLEGEISRLRHELESAHKAWQVEQGDTTP